MSTQGDLINYLVVARCLAEGEGQILHSLLTKKNDPKLSVYEDNANKLLSKSHKLTDGKRLRLTSDELGFDVHVLCAEHDGVKILFIAMVPEQFTTHHVISTFAEEWKSNFTRAIPVTEWKADKGKLKSRIATVLQGMLTKYNTSSLTRVHAKVDDAKNVMRDNVDLALANVEQLNELDQKSADIEASSRTFHNNAQKVKCAMCAQYWKLIIIGIVIALIILTIIIVVIVKKNQK